MPLGKRIIPIRTQADRLLPPATPQEAVPQLPPLSLYVHLPWCVQKCPYCDFNSHAVTGSFPESEYVAALIADLESLLPLIWGRRVVSVFFGGGTPSLFSVQAVDTLLGAFRSRLQILPDAEITLEANPGALETDRFAGYQEAGINRLSIGVQSFHDGHLKRLGRIHDTNQAFAAITQAAKHFDNFNVDLMYGLPEQTLAEAMADIDQALGFGVPHLSCYQLTIEPHTHFAAFPPELPEADLSADMHEAIEEKLIKEGFGHYEVSAYARPGRMCQHNLNYWTFGDYLGIGAGAHGKITLPDRVIRQARFRHPEQYLAGAKQGSFIQEEFQVEPDELPFEFMMNALRLQAGFDVPLFEARTGRPWQEIESTVRQAKEDGLLSEKFTEGRLYIAPTPTGRRYLNQLLMRFM